MFKNKIVLITGGTGSFGKKMTEVLLRDFSPTKIIIYSRDEYKQYEMQKQFAHFSDKLRFFIGDVRDKVRLNRALNGVDFVVHAAALKQVPAMEYNPAEAIKTNVIGAMNLIDCCIERQVKRIIALSTDKACNPINLYGASKLCSDKLFVAGNHYVGSGDTRFSVVRYGNVIGSRGSVVPFFMEKKKTGLLPITDDRMTRFWITLDQGVSFVINNFSRMFGGEIFVPKIPSMNIMDLARAIAPECKTEIVGIRPGEKIHETMISEDDARHTVELDDCYIIQPAFHGWGKGNHVQAKAVPTEFRYSSETNSQWLSEQQLKDVLTQWQKS
ncbi:UDP-N-acetylglucosamine 4,6-dehydratase (inverting) [candidate division WOR-1 bacterium RIFOXYB2_FULL_42_35]|uniref:UDP-N-acetylglucosamine 4,6-dehydratase (Inverting) n=1 Tax=candidate division WOR-1 bacterium RIFOXYC2_FULL_41_25 TaxID=1802586 RepID=A0A1F4TMP3_UNCSA|nr:MAG: UDP-N-acetylglucosamine 4,6-dehydratase (inverting) [candidate division WOR-1 bacterium RIFOXYA2_FULL_41_14]OGC24152.1 MAG: UDP-N-acetylglucosamine 4,6-dehydratase (inverting) [candidate division WOR-1 bacterium RIFOXYB2_FULL_42_35]OGC33839.1 MAG: UDP-N-acetylglucosamine 4,6-dehydratase (inverting) [candidate division WOR-1 bacterium RIFOXYC2_FULL_41_25]OGC43709.1 MAG: UDP-N-acetylglucosamine 4,6-dehydratase (inverting) [candidate division WOR-1 bacterium RIFOXYD2_FULL_41_8]